MSYSPVLVFLLIFRHKPATHWTLCSDSDSPFFFLCQSWHFLALRSLLKCHLLSPDYSISRCLFLSHDPIFITLIFFIFISLFLSFPLEWKTEISHSYLYSLLQVSAWHIACPQKNTGWLEGIAFRTGKSNPRLPPISWAIRASVSSFLK